MITILMPTQVYNAGVTNQIAQFLAMELWRTVQETTLSSPEGITLTVPAELKGNNVIELAAMELARTTGMVVSEKYV